MPRFFVDKSNIDAVSETITVTGEDARHIARSLRMACGEQVTVCDGCGNEYQCRLTSITDDLCVCLITGTHRSEAEPPYRLTVYQALVKGDRFDTVIQKAVEYGATRIVPFESSRCIVRLSPGKSDSEKIRRWHRIAYESAKQCGRGIIPDVAQPVTFNEMIHEASGADLPILCYEEERKRLLGSYIAGRLNAVPHSIAVIVGPEGGFAAGEARSAAEAGITAVSLGVRILRTESAAAFVLACISGAYELL